MGGIVIIFLYFQYFAHYFKHQNCPEGGEFILADSMVENGIFSFGELGSLWYGSKTDTVSRSDQRSGGKLHPADSMAGNGIFSFGELGSLWYGNKTDAVSRSDQRSSGKLHSADSMVENGIFFIW